MKHLKLISICILVLHGSVKSQSIGKLQYESENLRIERLTASTYVHISYLETDAWGKVPCNGLIVVNDGEAIVIDTPTNDKGSDELIDWIENKEGIKVKAVVATHFHDDCLGGLAEFHKAGIPSYALGQAIDFAKVKGVIVPQNGFDAYLELMVGDKKVINEFLGEGHTKDNIISYYPSEKVLFGGCLIKANKAKKGNLNDANEDEWSNSVVRLKDKYRDVKIVVPGHGKVGGVGLLDYTIVLFKE